MKPKNSKRILILSTVIVFLLVCVTILTLASSTMETTKTDIKLISALDTTYPRGTVVARETSNQINEAKAIIEDTVQETIGDDSESYTKEPMYKIKKVDVELIVHDSIIEEETINYLPEEKVIEFEPEISTIELETEPEFINEDYIYEEPIYMAAVNYEDDIDLSLMDYEISDFSQVYEEPIYYNEEAFYIIEDTYYEEPYIYEEPIYADDPYIYEEPVYIEEPQTYEEQTYAEESYDAPVSDLRSDIVSLAESYVGVTPYVWAGRSLTEGTDCSGFISLIYGEYGIPASPGSNDYQYSYSHIDYDSIQPGDVVVYNYGAHVGMYVGNDTIVHCSNPERGTIYSNMWYSDPTAYVSLIN